MLHSNQYSADGNGRTLPPAVRAARPSSLKAIRAMPNFKFTPVLMLTTEADESKKKEGQSVGATGWIVKPFNPEQLLKAIEKVMPA